jgi:hypothetical protein
LRLHLEGSPAAVIFPIDDERVAILGTFGQHGLVRGLNRNAELGVVQLALQPGKRCVVLALRVRNSKSLGSQGTRLDSDRAHPGS